MRNIIRIQAIALRVLCVFILLMAFLPHVSAQETANTIVVEKTPVGFRYSQDGQYLSLPQLAKALESNQEAHSLIKSAQTSNTFATVIGGLGGFALGWSVGTYIGTGEMLLPVLVTGIGLIVVSIPFTLCSNWKTKRAVNIFNSQVQTPSTSADVRFTLSGNGFGLTLRF